MNEHDLLNQLSQAQVGYQQLYDSVPSVKGADGKEVKNFSTEQYTELQKRGAELDELGEKLAEVRKLREASESIEKQRAESRRAQNAPRGESQETRSIFEQLRNVGDGSMAQVRTAMMRAGGVNVVAPELRAIMTTNAGYAPQVIRDPGAVDAFSLPTTILDVLPTTPISVSSYKYMKASVRTTFEKAKAVAETAAAEEAALQYTEVEGPVRTISVFVPFSNEQWDDEPAVQSLIQRDLPLAVRQRLCRQVILGDGVAPNLLGFMNAPAKQTQAFATDRFETAMRAVTKVRTGGGAGGRGGILANPNVILLHPNDWQEVALSKDSTGRYLVGDPQTMTRRVMWGVGVIEDLNLTEGTGAVLDTSWLELRMRQDATLTYTDSHEDNFVKRVWVVRADIRAGLSIKSDEAICTMTGI